MIVIPAHAGCSFTWQRFLPALVTSRRAEEPWQSTSRKRQRASSAPETSGPNGAVEFLPAKTVGFKSRPKNINSLISLSQHFIPADLPGANRREAARP